jgi:hypothetical protein
VLLSQPIGSILVEQPFSETPVGIGVVGIGAGVASSLCKRRAKS